MTFREQLMEEKMRSIADRMAEIVVKINRLEDEKKAKVKEYTEQIRSEEQILFSLASQYQRLENGEEELPFPDTGVPSDSKEKTLADLKEFAEKVANVGEAKDGNDNGTPICSCCDKPAVGTCPNCGDYVCGDCCNGTVCHGCVNSIPW